MNRRRGFTIMELSVTLVLIALLGVTVASFTVMMRRRVESNRDKLNMLYEMDAVEARAEQWVKKRSLAVKEEEGEPISVGESPNNLSDLDLKTIKEVSVAESVSSGDAYLYFFTVTFQDESQMTFTVGNLLPGR